MHKSRITKYLGSTLWALGIALLIFFKIDLWNLVFVFILILGGAGLLSVSSSKIKNERMEKESKKYFLFPGCEKSFIRTCLGLLIIIFGLMIIYFGKDEYLAISSIISLFTIIWGAFWFVSYLKCIETYNEPRNRNY